MNKVKKILTTLVAATLTVSTGLTSMPMFAHNVKAESKAETISSDTNDMSQYKKINGISSQTVLGADFSHYQLQKNAWKKVWKNYKGIEVSNVFEYVRSQGINTISVKVAVNPAKDDSYLSLEYAKETLKEAKKAGFFIRIFFVCTNNPEINVRRITQRYLNGGHEVPISKIISRYYKSLLNIGKAISLVDRVYVYDNSIENQIPRLLFRTVNGTLFKQYVEEIPQWAQFLIK